MFVPLAKSPGPTGGQHKKRRRVGATGHGKKEPAQIFETTEQRVRFVVANSLVSNDHASDPAARSVLHSARRVDICAAPRRAKHKLLPFRPMPRATRPAAIAPPARVPWSRISSRP